MTDLERLLDGFDDAIEAAIADRNRPKGGQHVPFHGDFGGCAVSSLVRMKWWSREFRSAIRGVRP